MLPKDQVTGALERIITVFATLGLAWLVGRGYLGEADAAKLLPAIVLLPSLAWGAWVNTSRQLAMSAANNPKLVVLAPEDIAGSTRHKNIVSIDASAKDIKTAVTEAKTEKS